jgi:hypothetical protein
LYQFVPGRYKPWYKLSRRLIARPGRPVGFRIGTVGMKGEHRERVEGAPHVQQLRVGVDVHRQLNVAVPHGGLRRPGGNPALAKQRPEGVPQGVNVQGPAAVVALVDDPLAAHLHPAGDAGRNQVAIQNLHQPARHVEKRGLRGQPGRDRGAGLAGFLLQPGQLVGEPVAQVRGEVIPQGDIVPLPVLLIGGVEGEVGHGVIEA